MTEEDPQAGPASTSEVGREAVEYAARIRRMNIGLAFGVSAVLAIIGLLPITQAEDRDGVLVASAGLLVVALGWFVLLPRQALGDRRVVTFAFVVLPVGVALLGLTGGSGSPYLPFFLFPVLTTVYAPRTRHTVVVGAASAVALFVVALMAGAEDPSGVRVARLATDLLELTAYTFFSASVGRTLRDARGAIAARAEALAGERSTAMQLAYTDPLTGLHNRRYADDLLERLVAEASRGRPFSVVAIDLDGLKALNDSFGHATGDRVLARIGDLLRHHVRGADVAIRVGGDEFLALLPGADEDQARAVGDRLCEAIATDDWSALGAPVSISCGAAEWRSGQSGAEVVKAADARLYEAKRTRAASR